MPYRELMVDSFLYLVRFDGPTVEDVSTTVDKVCAAAAATGEQIITVWIGSEETGIPQGELRRTMSSRMKDLLRAGEVHNVIEGSDFRTKILRSLVTNLFLLSGLRAKMFVYGSLEEALRALQPKLRRRGIDAEAVLREALLLGLGGQRQGAVNQPEVSASAASM